MGMLILHHQKTCKSYGALFVRNLALVQYYKAEVNQILIAVRFWQGFISWVAIESTGFPPC